MKAIMLALLITTSLESGASAASHALQRMLCDPHRYGATGNGITLDSTAINAAIGYCSAQGIPVLIAVH